MNAQAALKAAELALALELESVSNFVRRCLLLADVHKLRTWVNVRRFLRGKGRWNGSR